MFIRPAKLDELTQKGSYARSITTTCLILPVIGTSLQFMEHSSHWLSWTLLGLALSGWLFLPLTLIRIFDKTKHHDEREQEFALKAYAFSYRFLGMLVGISIWTLGFGMQEFGISADLDQAQVMALFFTHLAYLIYLPMAYVAWKMPPPLDDETLET
ncbi:hypothetical protein [Kordiimonas aquimaris]|uniref:hypothetical protein n=1 Tax=Kordiimonas aquimaris TaxID=707591 RepID=UPI0021D222D5|nr:hypothetical protein [Kordiimonas aquimaris]